MVRMAKYRFDGFSAYKLDHCILVHHIKDDVFCKMPLRPDQHPIDTMEWVRMNYEGKYYEALSPAQFQEELMGATSV